MKTIAFPFSGPGTGHTLHNLTEVPPGASLADILPAFAGVKHEIIIGTPNRECACCRKPFNEARKRRKVLRIAATWIEVPLLYSFHICGRCFALHQKGGAVRDSVMAAVQRYLEGVEAKQ